jgi:hypothetical protein
LISLTLASDKGCWHFKPKPYTPLRITMDIKWIYLGAHKSQCKSYLQNQSFTSKNDISHMSMTETEYFGWSTLKSNYYQTLIDCELNELFTWFNTLYTTAFMFTNLDFIHTRICYGFLNEDNHQEYLILLVAIQYME